MGDVVVVPGGQHFVAGIQAQSVVHQAQSHRRTVGQRDIVRFIHAKVIGGSGQHVVYPSPVLVMERMSRWRTWYVANTMPPSSQSFRSVVVFVLKQALQRCAHGTILHSPGPGEGASPVPPVATQSGHGTRHGLQSRLPCRSKRPLCILPAHPLVSLVI